MNITILQVPSINEITTGKANINSLRPIKIEDILGRDVNTDSKQVVWLYIYNLHEYLFLKHR